MEGPLVSRSHCTRQWIRSLRCPSPAKEKMSAVEAASVENSFYKLTLNENGDITSLFDKRNNKGIGKGW